MLNTGINQIKVMPLTVTVEKAEDNPTGRRRVKLSGFASRPEIDSDNEVIELGFFDRFLPDFLANPVMLWQHKRGDEQGLWTSVEPVPGEGYRVEGYMVDLGTPEDARRCAMAEEGIIRSLSVGFNAQYSPEYGYQSEETGAWHWTQNGKLMEISPVTFPACQNARFAVAKAAGFELTDKDTPRMTTVDNHTSRHTIVANGAAKGWGGLSSDAIMSQISNQLNPGSSDDLWNWYVYELYETYCIARDYPNDKWFRIEFAILNGAVVLGERQEVIRQWETVKSGEDSETRAVRNLEKLAQAAVSLDNITRHWAKTGGGPSAEMAETAARSIVAAGSIVKAGRVLSAANRGAVEGAVEALQEVLAKDDASRETPEPNNEDNKSGVLDIIMPAPRTLEIVS